MNSHAGLPDEALPALFQAADQASLRGQRYFVRASGLRLLLLVIAAVTAVATWHVGKARLDIMTLVTATVFVATASVELYLLAEQPERAWYDGRALAESAKTLTWRYAVGGDPFPKGSDPASEQEAARRFRQRLEGLLQDAPQTSIEATVAPTISHQLQTLRSSSFEERVRVYLAGRIDDQQHWYTSKAQSCRQRSHRWRVALLLAESCGVTAALLRGFEVFSFDLAGIIAAAVGSGAAWLAAKQYNSLARAYAFAANELALARARIEGVRDDHTWAAEVANAESAISREHTMWRASRTDFKERRV